jgi:uncharacterized membrane protein
VIYGLHAVAVLVGVASAAATVAGGFVFGLPSLAAVVLNYLKRGEVAGTWLESHFRWQIRTFWFTLLWLVLSFLVMLTIIGIPIAAWVMIPVLGLWVGYRVLRAGWRSPGAASRRLTAPAAGLWLIPVRGDQACG